MQTIHQTDFYDGNYYWIFEKKENKKIVLSYLNGLISFLYGDWLNGSYLDEEENVTWRFL